MTSVKRLKIACYTTCMTMSIVANLSPLLFLSFRSLYGISYSLLGTLVLANFVTQLSVDLIFSFFSHKFNIPKTVKLTPFIAVVGLLIYALAPFVFKSNPFLGILIGTIVFSAAGGLAEVLISPVIAAIPAKDPDREMSKLHSIYAWGVVFVVIFTTTFIFIFGNDIWYILALVFALIPLASSLLFLGSDIPEMETPKRVSGALAYLKNKTLWLFVVAIFLGGASELVMAQWSSSYLEQALGIPKIWGDVFGVAMFGLTLGFGRTLYSKIGKNVTNALFFGGIGATVCYLAAALSPFPVIGLLGCALTGFCVSMMWPGSLVVASERFPEGGVFIYAMMAAGGDLGASVGPQIIGVITDAAISVPSIASLAERISLSTERFGMKLGMLVGMLFPLISVFVFFAIRNKYKKHL